MMGEELPGLDEVPEEVLKEVEEAEGRRGRARARRGRRPARSDIMRAVAEVASSSSIRPEDFPDLVRGRLSEEGFDTSRLSDKRVWATYEEMVRRGRLRDYLRVVRRTGDHPE